MALEVVVGALLSLLIMGAIVYYVLRRSPNLFVADEISEELYKGKSDDEPVGGGRSREHKFTRDARLGADDPTDGPDFQQNRRDER